MSEEAQIATRYLFILGVLLIFFAFWGGSTKVLNIAGQNVIGLFRAGTGQNAAGTGFLAYPKGGPTS